MPRRFKKRRQVAALQRVELRSGRLPDAIEIRRRSNKDLSVGNRRRAKAIIVECVLRQDLKRRARLNYRRQPFLVRYVNLSVRKYRRPTVGAGLKSLLPIDLCAGLSIEAPHNPLVVNNVEIFS